MRKNEIILIAVFVALIGAYIHYFVHWGEKKPITISASLRPNRRTKPVTMMVAFTLDDAYKLKSLKVVPIEDGKVNPATSPVWSLSSDSNSVPIRAFRYGQPIRGMKPTLKGILAEPLASGVVYRMTVSTADVTSSKDFKIPGDIQ